MTIGTQLRRATLQPHYDAIVIGSGISGLANAVCLAKAGKKVLVLERHYTAGGFTHTYERKGYEWDVGLHYIGEVHQPESSLRRTFDYVSDKNIQWAPMDPIYDRIYLGDEAFDFPKGKEQLQDSLIRYFPQEKTAIHDYFKLIEETTNSAQNYFTERALPPLLAKVFYKKLTGPFLKFASQTTSAVLRGLTRDQKLIAVLTGQWGDYGLPPSRSSWAMHAMVVKHYMNGASYPVGGSASVARAIEKVLLQHGGQLITSAEVRSILVEGERALGVELQNGQRILANQVVSGVGVFNTFQRLLPDSSPSKKEYQQKLQAVTPSMAHMCLYLGIKASPKELGIRSTNLWIYPNADQGEHGELTSGKPSLDFPVAYVSFPSAKDPAWENKYPGKSTVEIVVPASFAQFETWRHTQWQRRGKDYDRFKKEVTERLIAILIAKVPQLKERIHFSELSTPLSTAHFSHYPQGEIYGISHDPERFKERWLRPDTTIKNLYLTGQDIVCCGVGGALSAGVLTAIRMLSPWRARSLIPLLQPAKSK